MADPTALLDNRERVLRAAERLFARDGIVGARARDISQLAGQRNPSALHYYFGSRRAAVEAILVRYSADVDAEVGPELDRLEARGALTTPEVIDAAIAPMVRSLDTEQGRDCVRIIPQMLHVLNANLHQGVQQPTTLQSRRVLALLSARMPPLPPELQRERLVLYGITVSGALAQRAHEIEAGAAPLIPAPAFHAHLVRALAGLIEAGV